MTQDTLWQAVVDRNENADGLFVYAVRSTGIYCRPSCASRRPRRDRVEFFPAAAMAESNGYRACRRCRPDGRLEGSAATDIVRRACEAIARHPDLSWSAAALARAAGGSVSQVQRRFRHTLGITPRDYVAACRRRRFLDKLRNGHSVTDAIYEAGYGSSSRVYEGTRLPGMTPATYGRGGVGATIKWATTATPVGEVLVAATDRGLCFVSIARADADLVANLRREFPRADIDERPSRSLGNMLAAVRRLAAGEPWHGALPLDIRGTAFEWRVWRALSGIPAGATRSYREVAAAIDKPTAVRAVARACAANPVALVVPCHRVIAADGAPRGYRWGVAVKTSLLEQEQKPGTRRSAH